MKNIVLVNLLGKYNGTNLLAIEKISPQKVIFIRLDNDEDKENYEDIEYYLRNKFLKLEIEDIIIDYDFLEEKLKQFISHMNSDKTIINISGGSRIMSLLAYKYAEQNNVITMYVDDKYNKTYIMNKMIVKDVYDTDSDIRINDFITMIGGELIGDSTRLFNEYKIHSFIRFIIENYSMWTQIKKVFRSQEYIIVEHDSLRCKLLIENMEKNKENNLYKLLEKLVRIKLIFPYEEENSKINIRFYNNNIKSFFMVSGSWLEALVFQVVSTMNSIQEVKSGVRFNWDNDAREVENELDVCAVSHSGLICISCKDTSKYDMDALNELSVYSEKLGGKEVIKILVATSNPRKQSVIKRAEEMDIKLIIFDGNVEVLKDKIETIIEP